MNTGVDGGLEEASTRGLGGQGRVVTRYLGRQAGEDTHTQIFPLVCDLSPPRLSDSSAGKKLLRETT